MARQPKVMASYRVSPDLKQAAKVRAEERGEAVTDVIVRALEEYVREPAQTTDNTDREE
jgi:hypothetical protein